MVLKLKRNHNNKVSFCSNFELIFEAPESPNKKKKKRSRKYIPKYKSAPWALLIALYRAYKENPDSKLTKKELIKLSSTLTDTPMQPQYTVRMSIY